MTWIKLSKQKPESNVNIEYKDSNGNVGTAYLCPFCLNEWRCPITGGGMLIDVIEWRYLEKEALNDMYDKKEKNKINFYKLWE